MNKPLYNQDTTERQEIPAAKSLDDIARMMAEARTQMRPDAEPNEHHPSNKPQEVTDEQDEADGEGVAEPEEESQDAAADEIAEADGEEDSGDSVDEDESDAGSAEDNAEDPNVEVSDVSEDILVEIEGFDEPVALKDLIEVHKADPTIKDRLVQTQSQLDSASAAYQKAEQDSGTLYEAAQAVIAQIDAHLSQPLVQEPPAGLKTSDPTRYIAHMEAYQQDQQRIQNAKQALVDSMQAFHSQREENFKIRQAHELSRLLEKRPEFNDPNKKVTASRDIFAAADHYGFSQEEVQQLADHRLMMMAHDAQQWRKLQAGNTPKEVQEEREEKVERKIRTTRVLRSKGSDAQNLSQTSKRRLKVTQNRAAQTGKTEDVAKFMSARRQAT